MRWTPTANAVSTPAWTTTSPSQSTSPMSSPSSNATSPPGTPFNQNPPPSSRTPDFLPVTRPQSQTVPQAPKPVGAQDSCAPACPGHGQFVPEVSRQLQPSAPKAKPRHGPQVSLECRALRGEVLWDAYSAWSFSFRS